MIAQTPPMGWNSWNTFGNNISDALIREMADAMADLGYRDAGYTYLVIDDCWSLRQRGADGQLVPDPAKFPNGMKAVADYVHSKGLKFGMYSCAGLMTCAGYPSSFGHEYEDAAQFASWGVDFLKYDFCNFPDGADCKTAYLTMSMALKASGREILFSACNWGQQEPWRWMRSIGAHMYRSTGDIQDNFVSFRDILISQLDNFCMSGNYCFNDIDMLTVGMYGKGNVAVGDQCTDSDYRVQFGLWTFFGVPLMLGGDLRKMNDFCVKLTQNRDLIRIDQDAECRPPYQVYCGRPQYGPGNWWAIPDNSARAFIRHLSGNEFAVGMFNLSDFDGQITFPFSNAGIPWHTGCGLRLRDVFTGEDMGVRCDYMTPEVKAHDCRIFIGTLEKP